MSHMYETCHIHRGNFSTNLSPFGKIRQVQNTTSCQKLGTINMNLIRISTVPGGTVQTKIFSTNQKRLGTNSDLLRNARWNLHFSFFLHVVWHMSHRHNTKHIWMSHVTYEWDMSHMYETCRICMRHGTYAWCMSHVYETCHTWTTHVSHRRRRSDLK